MDKKSLVESIMKSLKEEKDYTKEELNDIIQKAVTSAAATAENGPENEAAMNGEDTPSIQDATTPSQNAVSQDNATQNENVTQEVTQNENVTQKMEESEIPEPLDVSENTQGGKVEPIFDPGLFGQEFSLGATLQQGPTGNVMANMKPSPTDYNKQYDNSTKNEAFVRNENGELIKKD